MRSIPAGDLATKDHGAFRETNRRLEGSGMLLVLVQPADGGEARITFDQHHDVLSGGSMTLADAGALSAAIDDLRAAAARGTA